LFSAERRAGSAKVFSRENLAAQSRPSRFQGMEVRRLSLELQLVYLASHWAQDFIRIGGLVALADTIYFVEARRDRLPMGVDPESRQSLNSGNVSLPVAQLYSPL
jgi:hypothetical protein